MIYYLIIPTEASMLGKFYGFDPFVGLQGNGNYVVNQATYDQFKDTTQFQSINWTLKRQMTADVNRNLIPYQNPSLPSYSTYGTILTWLRNNQGMGIDGENSPIWNDSWNNHPASQPTPEKQPVYNLSRLNGLPTIKFSSSNKMYLSFGNVMGRPKNWTVQMITRIPDISFRQCLASAFYVDGNAPKSWGCIFNKDIPQGGGFTPDGSITSGVGDDTNSSNSCNNYTILQNNVWCVITVRYQDGNDYQDIFVNGIKLSVVTIPHAATQNSGVVSGFSIGRPGDYDGIYSDCEVAEFILFGGGSTSDNPNDSQILSMYNDYQTMFNL